MSQTREPMPSGQLRAQRSYALRQRGYTWDQIADVWEADYPNVGPRKAMRWAHNFSHQEVAEAWNRLDPGEPTMTKSRIYEFEVWPRKSGRRPSVSSLRTLARIYQTSARRLLTNDEFAQYDKRAQCEIEQISYRSESDARRVEVTSSGGEITYGLKHSLDGHDDSGARILSIKRVGGLSSASGYRVIEGLSIILNAHIQADAKMGSLYLIDAARSQLPIIDQACGATRASDRRKAVRIAIEFNEFCGWLYQDAGDFICAERWTTKALDYAMELGDTHLTSYILMRKSNIVTESGDPTRGLGLTDAALANADALTPRLRSVILRQRLNAQAAIMRTAGDVARDSEFGKDSEMALSEAIAGVDQQEPDLAPYCTPSYVEMEIGNSLLILGKPSAALPVFEASRNRWSDGNQARDNALCLARLAIAYAAAGDPKNASTVTEEAINANHTLGSWRVASHLGKLAQHLSKWSHDPSIGDLVSRIETVVSPFGSPPKFEG